MGADQRRGNHGHRDRDPTGAVIPDASVTVTNLGTNEVRKITTVENGKFSVHDLEPVTYRVEVEARGFAKSSVDHVKVDTASVATVDIKLQTGSINTRGILSRRTLSQRKSLPQDVRGIGPAQTSS